MCGHFLTRFFALLLGSAISTSGQRVVCYFSNWALYREGNASHLPEDLDTNLCTHINYAFAVLNESTLTIQSPDPAADIENNLYKKVTDLKSQNNDLKVLLSLGGGSDSGSDKYSRLVNDPANRQTFIETAIPYLQQYNFDGLDLDWEYPHCWQGDCTAGPSSDTPNFSAWVQELREAFDEQSPKLLLTSAVPPNVNVSDQSFDIPSISRNLDFMNVMIYDLHNAGDGVTGHHAQMDLRERDVNLNANAMAIMKYYSDKGAPKDKLVMGMPAYGRTFALVDPNNNGLGAPSSGVGEGLEGTLSYTEICKRIKDGWTVTRDPQAGPYASKDGQWVGYDDPVSASVKGTWVKNNGYGGVMVWDTSMDDFAPTCCSVRYPVLNGANYGLKGTGTDPSLLGCP